MEVAGEVVVDAVVALPSELLEDWLLAVDVENTKQAFEFNSYRCLSNECRNFVQACEHHMKPVVLEFAQQLGIDLSKPSQLESHQVNDGAEIMYSGKYHIIGEVIDGEILICRYHHGKVCCQNLLRLCLCWVIGQMS